MYDARRRSKTESGETPNELVMWIGVSCGKRDRRRAELYFGSRGGGTSAARKEAEVANAHEALGKHVQQEAAQEFIER
jgi:hypothetical protein